MTARAAAAGLLLVLASPAAFAAGDVYVELLWAPTPADAIARSVAYQFVADGQHDHRICVAAGGEDADVGGLELTIRDAKGVRISHVRHAGFRGRKTCFPADIGAAGAAGMWTVDATLGDGRTGRAAFASITAWRTPRFTLGTTDPTLRVAQTTIRPFRRPNGWASWSGQRTWMQKAE